MKQTRKNRCELRTTQERKRADSDYYPFANAFQLSTKSLKRRQTVEWNERNLNYTTGKKSFSCGVCLCCLVCLYRISFHLAFSFWMLRIHRQAQQNERCFLPFFSFRPPVAEDAYAHNNRPTRANGIFALGRTCKRSLVNTPPPGCAPFSLICSSRCIPFYVMTNFIGGEKREEPMSVDLTTGQKTWFFLLFFRYWLFSSASFPRYSFSDSHGTERVFVLFLKQFHCSFDTLFYPFVLNRFAPVFYSRILLILYTFATLSRFFF